MSSVDDDLTPRPPLRRRPRRRRRRSSAPATPGCGRRTTSPGPTRRCGSPCSRPRSPGSARPGATAAGARRCSRSRPPRWPAGTAAAAAVALHRAMQATVDEVGRVAAAEGIDCHFAKGGTVVARPQPGPVARAAAEVDEARAYGFDARPRAARRRPRRAPAAARPACSARTYTPALRGDPPGPAGPRAGPRGRAARGAHLRADPGRRDRARRTVPHRTRHGPGRRRGPGDRGLHARAARDCAARSRRCTR